ncbi:MAG TPA: PaaI family thioesterase [Gammaproteobacteria bacterium]|nr:PaaI family thioesterase [Gammaproteobacteria bacterium]
MDAASKSSPVLTPADPDFAARVRRSFERQGIMAHIGAELSSVEPGRVQIRLPYSDSLSQQHGFFHGGITTTIADSACGYSGFTLMPVDASVLTIEYKVNFLAPADGALLVATGRVVKPGRSIIVCHADVVVFNDEHERLCATMTETMMVMRGLGERE